MSDIGAGMGHARNSKVYDMVEEAERTLADKQSNIDTYRQAVLSQLKQAEDKQKHNLSTG